jgi:hypothetical protein
MNAFNYIQKIQTHPMMGRPRQLSFSVRSWIAKTPSAEILYLPYQWWGQAKRRSDGRDLREGLVLPDTELMIDGFQGSANSFATAAFKLCQSRHVKLAHHRHAPILMVKAVRWNIPVVLTVREPESTVVSLTSRWPHISVEQGLKSYIGFYKALQPYANGFVVSTFQLTTNHLDKIVEATNKKFNTNFDLIDPERANAECKEIFSSNPDDVLKRKHIKKRKKKDLLKYKDSILLDCAQDIYTFYEKLAQTIIPH